MDIKIDMNYCMARKNKKTALFKQCPNKKNISDYCLIHGQQKLILRIDEPLTQNYINTYMKELQTKKKHIIINDKIETINYYDSHYIKQKSYDINYKNMIEFKNLSDSQILDIVSGPAFNNPLISQNDIDPISLEKIWYIENGIKVKANDIQDIFLFSYKDKNDFIRCFNINTIKELFNQNIFKNPETSLDFPEKVITYAKIKINLLENMGVMKLKNENILLTKRKVKNMTYNTFFKFQKFSIFLEDKYFLNLKIPELLKLYHETKDFYKQNIPDNKKKELIPPDGRSFELLEENLKKKDKLFIQYYILQNINNLISKCLDKDYQMFGCYIAVGGLSTVSKEIRDTYPHISYSFM
jgi:hypothetical protein